MHRIVAVILFVATFFCPFPSLAGDEIISRIERFINVFESNQSYYVSRDYDLYGEGEMYICEKLCGNDINLSDKERNLCIYLINKRLHEDSDTPSLLLLWLRTKLPKHPKITILHIEFMPRYAQSRIMARLDDTFVVFNLFNEGESYHPMDIQSINGVNLMELIDMDMENGLSISSLLGQAPK